MTPNKSTLKNYIRLLHGDENAEVLWQSFHDSGKDMCLAKSFWATPDKAFDKLAFLNSRGAGIFNTVNNIPQGAI